jgi:hypothetical protein
MAKDKKLKLKKMPAFGPASAHITNLTAEVAGHVVALQVDARLSVAVFVGSYTFHVLLVSYTSQGGLAIEGETSTTILPIGVIVATPFSFKLVQTNAASGKYRLDAKIIGQTADGQSEVLDSREIHYTI